MPNMPDHVYKGPIFKRLDRLYNNQRERQKMLIALRDAKSGDRQLSEIGKDFEIFLPGGEASPAPGHENPNAFSDQPKHVEDHWFSPQSEGGWWVNDDTEEVIRLGAINALELSLGIGPTADPMTSAAGKPIEVLWACFGQETHTGSLTPAQVEAVVAAAGPGRESDVRAALAPALAPPDHGPHDRRSPRSSFRGTLIGSRWSSLPRRLHTETHR